MAALDATGQSVPRKLNITACWNLLRTIPSRAARPTPWR